MNQLTISPELINSLPLDRYARLPGGYLVEGVMPGMGQFSFPNRSDISFRVQRQDAVFVLPRYIKNPRLEYNIIMLDPDHPDYQKHLIKIRRAPMLWVDTETFSIFKWKNQAKTAGLNPWESRIRLIQIFDGETVYVVDFGGRGLSQFKDKKPVAPTPISDLPLFAGIDVQDPEPVIKIEDMANDAGIARFKDAIACLKFSARYKPWVFHNAHFDCLRLWEHLGVMVEHPVCTFVGARVFFGNYGKSDEAGVDATILNGGYSLKNLAFRFLDIKIDKEEQLSDWGELRLSHKQIAYACMDVIILKHLHTYLQKLFADQGLPLYYGGLQRIWDLENETIPVLVEAETEGLPYNPQEAEKQLRWVTETLSTLYQEWSALCGKIRHTQDRQVLALLQKKYPEHNIQNLRKENLATIGELPEIKIKLQIDAVDAIANNILAFQRSAKQFGGSPRTQFKLLTGFSRMASGGDKLTPNIQAVVSKKNPRIAHLNPPNPRLIIGYVDDYPDDVYEDEEGKPLLRIIGVDLAGAHARFCGDLAKDANAIAAFNDPNAETHSKVAVYVARALGRELDWQTIHAGANDKYADKEFCDFCKLCRNTAKNTFYGKINGAGAGRIQAQIANNTGLVVPIEACQAAIDGCNIMYPDMAKYHRQLLDRLFNTRVQIDGIWCAINNTHDGRRIVLPLEYDKYGNWQTPYTQAPASTWSAMEGTVIKKACTAIRKKAKKEWGLSLYGLVHDELNYKVKKRYALEAATLVNNEVGDAFASLLRYVSDGRVKNPAKLICKSWAEK